MKKFQCLLLAFLLILVGFSGFAQVSGVIRDQAGKPIQNAVLKVKNTNIIVNSNIEGKFTFNEVVANNAQIEASADGFVTRTVRFRGGEFVIVLAKNIATDDEIVVTSFGIKKSKRALTTATQEISGKDIAETQKDNWLDALAGRVAGANITPTGGAPGASTQIVLRGAVSIGGNNQPLIIVDGVPVDNQTMNMENLASGNSVSLGNRTSDYGNRAMDLNSADFETVTILKGPEASALYGSDGASGAIIITTKKGRAGKSNITYDNSFRFEEVYRFPEIQTTYGRGANGIADPNALINTGPGNQFGYFGPKYPAGTQLYNNIDNFFKTGFTQKHNLSVDGGNEISTFRLGLNYTDQDGIIPFSGFKRFTAKLTGTNRFSKKITLNSSFAYNNSITNKASKGAGGFMLNLLNFPSNIDVRDYKTSEGGRKNYRSTSTSFASEFDNPFWDVEKNRSKDEVDRLTTNFSLNIDVYKWLNLNYTLGIDFYNQTGDFMYHPQSRFGVNTNGFYSIYQQKTKNFNNVARATLRKKIKDFNNILIIGATSDDYKNRIESQRGERFYEPDFASMNNTDPLSHLSKTVISNRRIVRMFSNYTLSYKELAYLSLAGSREGNSTLNSRENVRSPYFNYGSVSGSFVFSDLAIIKKFKPLSFGKLRASYGLTGKGPYIPYILDNAFQPVITTGGGYAYGVTAGNATLRPESTLAFEFGAEIKFLKGRLSLDFTRYELNSSDQIIPARISYGTGAVLKYINGGLVNNKGIEIILNYAIIQKKNFQWDITGNFDRNRGIVKALPKDLPTFYDSDTWVFGNMRSQLYPGASITNLASFSTARNTKGDVLISPLSSLPTSNGDFTQTGDRQPDFRVGVINKFTYKNVSLSFNIDFRKGGDVFNGNEAFLYYTGLSKRSLDRERPIIITGVLNDGLQNTSNPARNATTVYPFYRADFYNSNAVTEADFMESVNWMRLRDMTLRYSLPKGFMKRQKVIKGGSIFITGTDLFLITNYSGADPSVNANNAFARGAGGAGIDYGSISTPRAINFGCALNF